MVSRRAAAAARRAARCGPQNGTNAPAISTEQQKPSDVPAVTSDATAVTADVAAVTSDVTFVRCVLCHGVSDDVERQRGTELDDVTQCQMRHSRVSAAALLAQLLQTKEGDLTSDSRRLCVPCSGWLADYDRLQREQGLVRRRLKELRRDMVRVFSTRDELQPQLLVKSEIHDEDETSQHATLQHQLNALECVMLKEEDLMNSDAFSCDEDDNSRGSSPPLNSADLDPLAVSDSDRDKNADSNPVPVVSILALDAPDNVDGSMGGYKRVTNGVSSTNSALDMHALRSSTPEASCSDDEDDPAEADAGESPPPAAAPLLVRSASLRPRQSGQLVQRVGKRCASPARDEPLAKLPVCDELNWNTLLAPRVARPADANSGSGPLVGSGAGGLKLLRPKPLAGPPVRMSVVKRVPDGSPAASAPIKPAPSAAKPSASAVLPQTVFLQGPDGNLFLVAGGGSASGGGDGEKAAGDGAAAAPAAPLSFYRLPDGRLLMSGGGGKAVAVGGGGGVTQLSRADVRNLERADVRSVEKRAVIRTRVQRTSVPVGRNAPGNNTILASILQNPNEQKRISAASVIAAARPLPQPLAPGVDAEPCPLCSLFFSSRAEVDVHLHTHTMVCNSCQLLFPSRLSLFEHRQQCASRAEREAHMQPPAAVPPPDQRAGDFVCNRCGATFNRISQVNEHALIFHQLPYRCPQCDRRDTSLKGYEDHVRASHLVMTPYPCNLCQSTFVRATLLVRHFHLRHLTPRPTHAAATEAVSPDSAHRKDPTIDGVKLDGADKTTVKCLASELDDSEHMVFVKQEVLESLLDS